MLVKYSGKKVGMNAGALYLVGDALVRTTHTKVVLFCLVLFFVLLGNLRPLANYQ